MAEGSGLGRWARGRTAGTVLSDADGTSYGLSRTERPRRPTRPAPAPSATIRSSLSSPGDIGTYAG